MENSATVSGGDHLETQSLLPWYVSLRLDDAESARVETHLAQCPECRADVTAERRLAAEWASLPMESETSWLRLRGLLARDDAKRASSALSSRVGDMIRDALTRRPPWLAGLGWGLAAAQGVALAAIAIVFGVAPAAPPYHALGAGQAPSSANALVMFEPETSERRLRDMLTANHARIVGGPTASGAYVLHLPGGERSASLARMRASPDVVLAQPIDPGATR
jgi:hypothetical protein